MSEPVPVQAATGRSVVGVVSTGEVPRPQWWGLFREPDLPSLPDEDD